MINLHFTSEQANRALLNATLLGWFLLEIAVASYIFYLIVHHIPKQ